MNIVPVFPPWTLLPRLPQLDMKPSTFGSPLTTSAAAFWCWTMASNEMPCAASVGAKICPVSLLGMKPFGTIMKSQIVASRTRAEKASISRFRLRAHFRPRS